MATTKIIIRTNKANSKGECVIYVRYTHNQKSIQITTGEKIHPDLWDEKNERVRKSKLFKGSASLNRVTTLLFFRYLRTET